MTLCSTTVGLNLAVVLMFYTPKVPLAYSNLLGVPEIALMNIMACLVYRNVRFGIFREAALGRNNNNNNNNNSFTSAGTFFGSFGTRGNNNNNTPSGLVFSPNPRAAHERRGRRGSSLGPDDVERGQIGLQKHRNVQIELDGMRSDVDTVDHRTSLGEDKSGY